VHEQGARKRQRPAPRESAPGPLPCTFKNTQPVIDGRLQMDPNKAVWLSALPDGVRLTQREMKGPVWTDCFLLPCSRSLTRPTHYDEKLVLRTTKQREPARRVRAGCGELLLDVSRTNRTGLQWYETRHSRARLTRLPWMAALASQCTH
jgi:hypothetical protein